jgi:hypothetical protein
MKKNPAIIKRSKTLEIFSVSRNGEKNLGNRLANAVEVKVLTQKK